MVRTPPPPFIFFFSLWRWFTAIRRKMVSLWLWSGATGSQHGWGWEVPLGTVLSLIPAHSRLLRTEPGWDLSISRGWRFQGICNIFLIVSLWNINCMAIFLTQKVYLGLLTCCPLCWIHWQIYLWIFQVFEALKYFMTAELFIWGYGITQDSGLSVSGSPVCPYENVNCFLCQFSPVCFFSA